MSLPTHAARSWVQRWDRQQEHYLPDREQRFTVIADIVTLTAERLRKPNPVVLDIGCGPGSLSARIRQRLPMARVIGVDSDPLLLGLASANYPWLELIDTDLRSSPQWTDALPVREFDAVVSTTALHWLQHEDLATLYADLAGIIRSGGVFVNSDWMPPASSGEVLDRLVRDLRDQLARRAGVLDREDWAAWWNAVNTAPELAELVAQRGTRPLEHMDGEVGFDEQARLLRELGFAEVAPVWQFGPDRILVGIR